VAQGDVAGFHPAEAAVLVAQPVGEVVAFAPPPEEVPIGLFQHIPVVRMDPVEEIAHGIVEVLAAAADDVEKGLGNVELVVPHGPVPDAVLGRFHGQGVALFRFLEGGVGLAHLRGFHGREQQPGPAASQGLVGLDPEQIALLPEDDFLRCRRPSGQGALDHGGQIGHQGGQDGFVQPVAHGPGLDAENALGLGIDAADQLAFVQYHQGQGGGIQELLQFLPGRLNFPVAHLQFLVGRFQFLIGGPDFLRGGFQFLVGGLELLVGGLHFLVSGFQLFQGELVAGGNFFQGSFQGRHLGGTGGGVGRGDGGGQGFHQH